LTEQRTGWQISAISPFQFPSLPMDSSLQIRIKNTILKKKITLTASKDGYENREGTAYPETGQEIGIVMNRKAPK